MPPTTFESALKNRQENQRTLIQLIKQNLESHIHYGRVHVAQDCPLAKAGEAYLCWDFSHDGLNRLIHERFNKHLDDLNRVEASRFIEHING